MSLDKTLFASLVLSLGLASTACALDPSDSSGDEMIAADDGDGADGSSDETAEAWTVSGASLTTLDWDTGSPNNLSGWANLSCFSAYGSTYMLTGIEPFKENTGNADNFVGKTMGKCTSFNTVSGLPVSNTGWVNIFTGPKYRTPGLPVEIPSGSYYPTAVQIQFHPNDIFGYGYVKDMRLGWDRKNATATAITHAPTYTAWGTGYSGSTATLACPDQQVVTGLQVKYDLNVGKIRHLQVFCRPITN